MPTVYQLTGDARWDAGGEFWEFYNLGLEESDLEEDAPTVLPDMVTENFNGEKSVLLDTDGAVKVLSEKTAPADNFRDDRLDSELILVSIDGLSEEFGKLLQMN
jgi:hypothetical protein